MLHRGTPCFGASEPLQDVVPNNAHTRVGHQYSSTSLDGNASAHFGNVYHQYYRTDTVRELLTRDDKIETDQPIQLGLHLGKAPVIDRTLFIGRQAELRLMGEILGATDYSPGQRKIVLGGIGGIGKTQLALAYARQHHSWYESIIWLNATSEATLKASFRTVAQRLLTVPEYQNYQDEQILLCVHRWLSHSGNAQWLLIFDNYDEPEHFKIEQYYPPTLQGAIIVTTQLPEQVMGRSIKLLPLEHVNDGLQILKTRSERADITSDPYAHRLVERLGSLPLALATAGAYLKKSTLNCEQYLRVYDLRWNIDPRRRIQLIEYEARTLYSTWDLSFSRLRNDDPDAAQLLALLAYFDHQNVWYELLRKGINDDSPSWLIDLTSELTNFDNRMATLVEYCFVEVLLSTKSYSVHSCVHDWTLAGLNKTIGIKSYWYALDCVTGLIENENRDAWSGANCSRVVGHAARLAHLNFRCAFEQQIPVDKLNQVVLVAELLHKQKHWAAAEEMYQRALDRMLTTLGPDDPAIFSVFNDFGNLCYERSALVKAQDMYQQALEGRERTLGPDDPMTLRTVNNLGLIYLQQGNTTMAEDALERALAGKESNLGAENCWTLTTVHNLGTLYRKQGKRAKAEEMYNRALAGREKTLGPDHRSTLKTLNNLAALYMEDGNLEMAEEIYQRVLAGKERALGPDDVSTLATVHNLGVCFSDQGKLAQAVQMFRRALAGKLKVLGQNHPSTFLSAERLKVLDNPL